jgi:hypothetical protein
MFKSLMFNFSTNNAGRTNGVYRIAQVLRENNWEVEVIDFARFWTLEQLKEVTRQRVDIHTKFIGISQMFSGQDPKMIYSLCKWIKTEYPTLIIIHGSSSKQIQKCESVDYWIYGYSDSAIITLLKYCFSNGPRPKFDIIFDTADSRKMIDANNNYVSLEMADNIIEYEERDFIAPNEFLYMQFSRGCKFSCKFCNSPFIGLRDDYTLEQSQFEYQMKRNYDMFGTRYYMSSDETFNDRTEKISKYADVVEKLDFKPYFGGFIRLDLLIAKQQHEELARMGYLAHYYGVESFNKQSMSAMGKGMNPDKIKQGLLDTRDRLNQLSDNKYRGTTSIICGLPGESPESFMDGIRWLDENWRGQSVNMFSLEIFNGELFKPSPLSMDYKKYGYKEMSPGSISKHKSMDIFASTSMGSIDQKVLWENEYYNSFTAQQGVNDAWEYLNPLENSSLDTFTVGYTGNDDLDTRLSLKRSSSTTHGHRINIARNELVKDYIEKKLNYVKTN